MEEDIKILENIIVEYNTQVEDYKYFSVPVRLDERDIEALENLLTRYKDIKRINSDLQGEQEQLYNKIDKLEEKNEEWQRAYQEEKDKQFELLRENKRLEEENKELKEQVTMFDEAYSGAIKESKKWFDKAHDSIPKLKVKEKIEEYKKVIEITKEQLKHEENVDVRRRLTTTIEQATAGILALQELLREE